jgi:hypothetical protein
MDTMERNMARKRRVINFISDVLFAAGVALIFISACATIGIAITFFAKI